MRIETAQDAAEVFKPIFAEATNELLAVAYVDGERQLIECRRFEAGNHGDDDLPLREIVADALRFGADAVVIGRSRPGGDSTPSQADLHASRVLAETLLNVGIRLLDHLILAGGEVSSLRELGLL